MSVPLRQRAILRLLRLLPQGALSRIWGRVAVYPLPRRFRGPVNRGFARLFNVNIGEAERPPDDYSSLGAFFVRRLREGARTWPADPGIPASPVDGILGTFGSFEEGTVFQAKGIQYEVSELLAGDSGRFASGLYFTIYLSPRHYHRIHAPLACDLREARSVPGRLLPVNAPAVRSVPDLFPRNERLVALMGRGIGDIALVAVGAYNVGSIEAAFDPQWNSGGGPGVTNRPRQKDVDVRSFTPPLPIEMGQELMAFHLGSTVVLVLAGRGRTPSIRTDLREGMELSVGTPLLDGPFGEGAVREGRRSAGLEASPGTQ